MIGLFKLSTMNDRTDAVYVMVSVPLRITNPSKLLYSSFMILVISDHTSGTNWTNQLAYVRTRALLLLFYPDVFFVLGIKSGNNI